MKRTLTIFHYLILILIISAGAFLRISYIDQPMRLDEAETYNQYIANSIFVRVISDYRFPNNHILHTALMYFSAKFFGSAPSFLRLPAMLGGVAMIIGVYFLARKLFDKNVALFSALIVATSSYLIEYSTNARGYTLMAFFALLMLYAAHRIVFQNQGWFLFSISTFLGFLTLPTTLYVYLGALAWLAFYVYRTEKKGRRKKIRQFAIYCLAVPVVLVFFGYLPAIIFSGFKAISAAKHVTPLSLENYINQIPITLKDAFTLWHRDYSLVSRIFFAFSFLTVVIGYFSFLKKTAASVEDDRPRFKNLLQRNRSSTSLIFSIFISTFAVSLFQRIIPYQRTLTFLIPLYAIVAGFGVSSLLQILLKKFFAPVYYFFAILLLIYLSNTILINKSVLRSGETGAFPDAEVIVNFLRDKIKPGDQILAETPAKEILYFYLQKYGINPLILEANYRPRYPPRQFIVFNYNQLNWKEWKAKHLETDPEARVIQQFSSSEILLFRHPEKYRSVIVSR